MQAYTYTSPELTRIDEICQALSEEITYIEKHENQEVALTDGKLVDAKRGRFYYEFKIEAKIVLKGAKENHIVVDGHRYQCSWKRGSATFKLTESNIDCNEKGESEDSFPEDEIEDSAKISIITSGEPLIGSLTKATLLLEHAKFLKCVRKSYDTMRAQCIGTSPAPQGASRVQEAKIPVLDMAEQLFAGISSPLLNKHSRLNNTNAHDDKKIQDAYDCLNPFQQKAVELSTSRSLACIWGPPGTGKTHALALVVIKHLQAGRKVLLVSNTNVAVDVAMQAICKRLVDTSYYQDYKLLRLRENGGNLERMYPNVSRSRQQSRSNAPLAVILDKVSLIATSCFNATTSEIIKKCGYDVLVVDEASTASLTHLYAIAKHAKLAINLAGDFLQLPPIGKGRSQLATKWLQRSIYDELQISTVKSALACDFVAPLRTQYRMHPRISTIANHVFYDGMLLDDDSTREQLYEPASALLDANSVTMIDMTSLINQHYYPAIPRFNRYNTSLCLDILNSLLLDGQLAQLKIGYTSPFKRQTQQMRRLWRELLEGLSLDPKVINRQLTIDTIHSFQGNQVDLLLLDLTECATTPDISFNDPSQPGWRPDLIVNVAITRTRKKLIIVGNLPYFKSRYPQNSFIHRVLSSATSADNVVHAADIMQMLKQ